MPNGQTDHPPSAGWELVLYRMEKLEEKIDIDIHKRFERIEAKIDKLEIAHIRLTTIGFAILMVWPYVWPFIRELLTGK